MTLTLPASVAGASVATAPERAGSVLGPNWFATVMGTGILAVAAATLPWRPDPLLLAARAAWVLAAGLLALVTAATVLHHRHQGTGPRRYLEDPALVHFHGAVAMAPLTVGAGALLVGRPVLGPTTAVAVAAVLWVVGTLLGLATALILTRHVRRRGWYGRQQAGGAWLMPVVPPMVSAATGPLLVPHLPPGAPRTALLALCLALFGLALALSTGVLVVLGRRLARHGAGPAAALPTLFLVLGPLGQSVTAAHTIGAGAAEAGLDRAVGPGPEWGLVYGIPTWALAVTWLLGASAVLLRAAVRSGVPFSMTWWSFTFPVGTVVTGTSALAAGTGSALLGVVAVALFAALVGAWAVVAARTVAGLWEGSLLRAPVPTGGPAPRPR